MIEKDLPLASSRRATQESCSWIAQNVFATTQDIPDRLLKQWLYREVDGETVPNGFHLAVFTFGVAAADFAAKQLPHGQKREYRLSDLLRLFQIWQLKLATAELQRNSSMSFEPMPLFTFMPDEIISWCFKDTGSGPRTLQVRTKDQP